MSGDSDFFDAIMALSVGAARDVAPAWGLSGERAEELGKKNRPQTGSRFLSSLCGCSSLYLGALIVP